jgi:uncharacterized delta-60 repeat protein
MAVFSAAGAPGDLDMAFNPDVAVPGGNPIYTAVPEPQGGILIGGGFHTVGGVSHPYFARLFANGALDASFNPNAGGPVRATGTLRNGKIIAAGEFTAAQGTTRNRIAQYSPEGTLDPVFDPNADGFVNGLLVQPDDRIVFNGLFTSLHGTARNRAARDNPNGTLDPQFNPGADNNVRGMALQPDGNVLLAGVFTTLGGLPRNRIARVLSDGSPDTDFNPNANGEVYCVVLQPDGKVLIGGDFTTVAGVSRTRLARLQPNGSLDPSLNVSVNGIVRWIMMQTDGKILLGGEFTTVGGVTRNRIARLLATGTLDTTFNPNANERVYCASMYADGRILIGGNFTSVGGTARNSVARLANDPANQSLAVPSPAQVQWLRGGASPETNQVTFEYSSDGESGWTLLGSAVRITGGWELAGLTLPANGLIRAGARTTGGYGNGSSVLLETVTAYSFSPIEIWRHTHFGTIANSGSAALDADPDLDGMDNLLEFAFGLDPNTPDAAELPAWEQNDDDFVLTFTSPPDAGNTTYIAEYSSSLEPESWTPIPNTSSPPHYKFYAPVRAGRRLYLRSRITP